MTGARDEVARALAARMNLAEHSPSFALAFDEMCRSVHDGDGISLRESELVMLAAHTAMLNTPAIDAHTRRCLDAGASSAEVHHVIRIVATSRAASALYYGTAALDEAVTAIDATSAQSGPSS